MRDAKKIIIQSEEEHEHEEESIATKKMPDVMLIIESKECTLTIKASWLCSRNSRILFLFLKEVQGWEHADEAEDHEDNAVPFKLLATVELHDDIVECVSNQVSNENIQQDRWQSFWIINSKVDAEGKIGKKKDCDEDPPKSETSWLRFKSNFLSNTLGIGSFLREILSVSMFESPRRQS